MIAGKVYAAIVAVFLIWAARNPPQGAGSSVVHTEVVLDAARAVAPISTTTYALLTTRGSTEVVAFDVSVNQTTEWHSLAPRSYTGGTVTIEVRWCAATATTGSVVWGVSVEDQSVLDLDEASLDTEINSSAVACSAACGKVSTTTITATQAEIDDLAAGSPFRLRLRRETEDATDTMPGDAQVLSVRVLE